MQAGIHVIFINAGGSSAATAATVGSYAHHINLILRELEYNVEGGREGVV